MMKNFDSWLTTDTQYDANELHQCMIDDRVNELMNTIYKPAEMLIDAMSELSVADNEKMMEYVGENNMAGLGKFIYLKAYDFASMLAEKQAEKEFDQGAL
tara:strand:+ start:19306 stop:19605 length:300 start_codon:yes stop_codon:yes gene_type:complete